MKNFRFWHQPQQQRQLLQVFKLSPVTLKTSLTSGRCELMAFGFSAPSCTLTQCLIDMNMLCHGKPHSSMNDPGLA